MINVNLVLRLNEIYHDVENKDYDNKHFAYFDYEGKQWQKLAKQFIFNHSKNINLLDIGTGTGFVPVQIRKYLNKDDLYILSDISSNMLKICKKNILEKNFKNKFVYLKLDGNAINYRSDYFDFITINSVLHHIPELKIFLESINNTLKLNGLLIIGHEPYNPFYKHHFLWNNFQFCYILLFGSKPFTISEKSGILWNFLFIIAKIINLFLNPKMIFIKILKFNKKFLQNNGKAKFIAKINEKLLKENIITNPLSYKQISELIDIHSPTAGGLHKNRVNLFRCLQKYLPNFKVVYFETYNHLSKISHKNKFIKFYDFILKRFYPRYDSTFFVVMKKVKE